MSIDEAAAASGLLTRRESDMRHPHGLPRYRRARGIRSAGLALAAVVVFALAMQPTHGAFGQGKPPATPVSEPGECELACEIPIAKMCAHEIDALERKCAEEVLPFCVAECVADLAAGVQVSITTDFAAQRAYESRQSSERIRQMREEHERQRQAKLRRIEQCEAREQQAYQRAEVAASANSDRYTEEHKSCETQFRMLGWDEEGYRPGINSERMRARNECMRRLTREDERRKRQIYAPWRQVQQECREIRYGLR